MNIKNFGKKSADEVLERLHAMGLHLSDETIPDNIPPEALEENEAFAN